MATWLTSTHSGKMLGRFAAAIALIGLVACGGGGSGATPNAPTAPGQPTTAPLAPSGSSSVQFVMQWAPPKTSAVVRRPRYLAPTALSASITVISGPAPFSTTTPIIEILNSPTTTLTFSAPNGLDTFLIQTYDEQNALGNVLSKAYVTQTVSGSSANVVSATLNGVIAKLNLGVSSTAPPAGTAAAITVTATGLDADGNVIVGPGNYDTPIQLSIIDPANSGTLSLSKNVIQVPGTTATLNYNGGALFTATLLAVTNTGASASVTIAPTPTTSLVNLPGSGQTPQWITVDGNDLWFTAEGTANAVVMFHPATSAFTEHTIPTASAGPQGIILGSDGRLWFTETGTNKIGAVTTGGVFTEFSTLFASDGPFLLADRGDGTIWYTGIFGDHVGYQGVTSGVAGETTIPTAASAPYGIAFGPDLNIYFSESQPGVDKIGRINNLFGTVTELHLTAGSTPEGMVRGVDGNIWVAENGTSKIARISPNSFSVTAEYPTLTPNASPVGMAVGPDGSMWFTESGLDRIGRITTNGVVTEYPITGGHNLGLKGIAVKPNGTVWFTASNTSQIGSLTY